MRSQGWFFQGALWLTGKRRYVHEELCPCSGWRLWETTAPASPSSQSTLYLGIELRAGATWKYLCDHSVLMQTNADGAQGRERMLAPMIWCALLLQKVESTPWGVNVRRDGAVPPTFSRDEPSAAWQRWKCRNQGINLLWWLMKHQETKLDLGSPADTPRRTTVVFYSIDSTQKTWDGGRGLELPSL